MRLYFKVTGVDSLEGAAPGTRVYNETENVLITDGSGTEHTVKDWASKIAWMDFWPAANSGATAGYGEIDLCIQQGTGQTDPLYSENTAWLAGIQKITFKQGFGWLTAAGQGNGATVEKDVILWNGGIDAGWQRYADSITATLKDEVINQGDALNTHLTVKAHYGDEEEEVTDYTVQNYDSTKAGEKQTVTVKYQDKTTTVDVTVTAADKTLTDIELSGKTEFDVPRYDELNLDGLIVTAKFDTGDPVVLEEGAYTVDPFDPWTTEDTVTLKVSYTYAGKTCEKSITVHVTEPDTTKGLKIQTGYSTYWSGGATLYFTFEGITPPTKFGNACYLENFPGNRIADYLVIKMSDGTEQKYTQWKAGHSDWIFASEDKSYANNSAKLVINLNGNPTDTLSQIQSITVKAGFQWVGVQEGKEGSAWGAKNYDNYQNWPGAVLKEDVVLWKGAENWEKKVTKLEAKTTQTAPVVGEEVDLNAITVTATYFDGTTGTLSATSDMIDVKSFTTSGEQKVTVTYQDQKAEITYQVSDQASDREVSSIKIETEPSKKTYPFGTLKLDVHDIVVKKVFGNGEEDAIPVNELSFEGYNPYTLEEQTITVKYETFTATFTITMEPLDKGLEVEWIGTKSFDPTVKVEGLTIVLGKAGADETKAVQVPFEAPGVIEFLKINSHPASEYVEKGYIDWVGFYHGNFVIALNTSNLVWGTASTGEYSGGKSKYVEGTSEVIKTVEILPGFQLYTSKDDQDHWGTGSVSMDYLEAVEYSVMTDNVLLYNGNGEYWNRVLKQGEGSNLDGSGEDFKLVPAEDAITLKTSGKTTYKKGEKFSIEGFTFTLKFEDGGTQDVALSEGYVDSDTFDPDTPGEQNVIIEIAGGKYTLKVTVTEDGGSENPVEPGDNQGGDEQGGCGGILGLDTLMLMGGACAVALLCKRRK